MNLKTTIGFRGVIVAVALGLAVNAALAADNGSGAYRAPSAAEQRQAVEASVAQSSRHKTDTPVLYKVMLDRLERDFTDKGDFTYLEGQAWVGSSTNRLWLKGEGTRIHGNTEDANLEGYYSRAISAYWDAQAGVRQDFASGDVPSREWLGFGFQGLAPYKFDTSITAYVGRSGRTALRLQGEYDFYITQRLIFWPELELNAYGKSDPARRLGRGLSDGRLALRLRYEIWREFAPYAGVQWTKKFGRTADYARDDGDPDHDMQFVVGLRMWW